MSLLDDITSRDPQRIWSSACAIRTLRDPHELSLLVEHLDEIKQKTAGIDLGGALRPNSSHLEFAIRKLEFVNNRKGCLCALYPMDELYDPDKEGEAGNIAILSNTTQDWEMEYECQCRICSTRYHVEQREYHYTWWRWTRV